jgi:hypothetical protein
MISSWIAYHYLLMSIDNPQCKQAFALPTQLAMQGLPIQGIVYDHCAAK